MIDFFVLFVQMTTNQTHFGAFFLAECRTNQTTAVHNASGVPTSILSRMK